MSNEHTFTMTPRQQKRYRAEQHNLRYEAEVAKRGIFDRALQQGSNVGKSMTTDTLLDHLGVKAKINPQDLPDSVEITPAVQSEATKEIQVIGRSQRDNADRRVVVLGADSGGGLGGNVAQRLAFATPGMMGDIGKRQAREEICQLLIDEGDNQKFVDYLANLSNIPFHEHGMRKLKLPKLNEMDPAQIHACLEMYEDVMREVHGLPKREGAPDRTPVEPIVKFHRDSNDPDYVDLLNKGTRLTEVYKQAEPGFTPPGAAAKRMLSQMALTKAVEIISEQTDDKSR